MAELDLGHMNETQRLCEKANLETQLRKERLDSQGYLVEIIQLKRRIKELEYLLDEEAK
jgi:hypothetical protein